MQIFDLTVEGEVDPLGIDCQVPRLGWRLASDRRGAMQSAYQIQIAGDPASLERERDLLCDTGEVESSASQWVSVPIGDAISRARYFWRVRVRDELGRLSDWSAIARWEVGLLSPGDWCARWISPHEERDRREPAPAPMLRHVFRAGSSLVRARAYVTAQGLYALRLNGERVGNAILTPGWTSYGKRIQYQIYDITSLLRDGENVLGATLGDGWFRGNLWPGRRNRYGEELALLCQLELFYADGRSETVCSDADGWSSSTGGILRSELYTGEVRDARLEPDGWDRPGFDDAGWLRVLLAPQPPAQLIAQSCPPVRRIEELTPIALLRAPSGLPIVDFGQNISGRTKISLSGPTGTMVTLRHAEMLDGDGALYVENLQSASQTDTFVLRGEGLEVFEPEFTCHGFRYVEIDGLPGDLTSDMIRAVVCHSDLAPVGEFACSEPLVDRLQSNTNWSLRDNFVDIPTDCPQRAERMGWTADVQLIGPTAAFNFDVRRFLMKWLDDLVADQRDDGAVPWIVPCIDGGFGTAGWSDAVTIVPWMLYRQYGDLSILARYYDAMKRWVLYADRRRDLDGIWSSDFQFGDWLDYLSISQNIAFGATPPPLAATAYFAHSVHIVARVAELLGLFEDTRRFQRIFEQAADAFAVRFFDEEGALRQNASQAGYVLALDFDLLPEAMRSAAAARLAADVRETGHLTTGFLGTPRLLPVLTRFGHLDEAYRLLERRTIPSWLYPVTKGATTIWERWDGILADGRFKPDTDMNSFNHYLYGAVGEWLYETAAGLGLDALDYRHIRFRPKPGGSLTKARARHHGMLGEISIDWHRSAEAFTCAVEIPVNARATLSFPGGDLSSLREGGRPWSEGEGILAAIDTETGPELQLASGGYQFVVELNG